MATVNFGAEHPYTRMEQLKAAGLAVDVELSMVSLNENGVTLDGDTERMRGTSIVYILTNEGRIHMNRIFVAGDGAKGLISGNSVDVSFYIIRSQFDELKPEITAMYLNYLWRTKEMLENRAARFHEVIKRIG